MYMGVLSTFMSVHHVCAVPVGSREGIESPGNGLLEMIVSCHVGSGSSGNQPMLLAIDPSFQHPEFNFQIPSFFEGSYLSVLKSQNTFYFSLS